MPPPRLVAAIRDDPEAAVREGAVESMAHFSAEAAIPIVLAASEGGDPPMHQVCRTTMAKLRPSMATLPALIAAVGSRDVKTRALAAEAIGRLGPAAQPAVPALIAAMNRAPETTASDGASYIHPIDALARIAPGTPQAPRAIEALLNVIKSRPSHDLSEQMTAFRALDGIRPAGGRVGRPTLNRATPSAPRPENWRIVESLAATLGKIAPGTDHDREAVDALVEAMTFPDNDALEIHFDPGALGRFGPSFADRTVPALIAHVAHVVRKTRARDVWPGLRSPGGRRTRHSPRRRGARRPGGVPGLATRARPVGLRLGARPLRRRGRPRDPQAPQARHDRPEPPCPHLGGLGRRGDHGRRCPGGVGTLIRP